MAEHAAHGEFTETDRLHMQRALTLARAHPSMATSRRRRGRPRRGGAGRGGQPARAASDPTAHAEVLAFREASEALGGWRLPDTTIYVTLEPCAMCAGAISLARVPRLVFEPRTRRAEQPAA